MDASLEALEKYGLVADEDSFRVLEFDRKRAFKLHRDLWELVFSRQQEPIGDSPSTDAFSFMASASMRGRSTCSSPFCRLQKLDFLARYTALYANKVLFPLPLSHPSKVDTVAESRDELAQTALILLRLRRLIDGGMVVPVVMRSTHCTHVIRWVRDMTGLIHEIADDATLEIQKHFRVMYQTADKAPTGRATVYVEGPEDFLEHGGGVPDQRSTGCRSHCPSPRACLRASHRMAQAQAGHRFPIAQILSKLHLQIPRIRRQANKCRFYEKEYRSNHSRRQSHLSRPQSAAYANIMQLSQGDS